MFGGWGICCLALVVVRMTLEDWSLGLADYSFLDCLRGEGGGIKKMNQSMALDWWMRGRVALFIGLAVMPARILGI